jgi:hypothetical protein
MDDFKTHRFYFPEGFYFTGSTFDMYSCLIHEIVGK